MAVKAESALNNRAVMAIALKDIRAITANLQVWLPMAIVPVMLGIILPTVMVFALQATSGQIDEDARIIIDMISKIPAGGLRATLDGLPTIGHKVVFMAANYMMAPFFLIIPLMTASVISADSFAGEKERGTLETLLFAPVSIRKLFTGKVLASLIPSVVLSLATFLLATVTINLAGWPLFGEIFFPQLNWLPLMLLVIPMVSMLAILLNLVISARVATFQAAYQMGGMVVLPFMVLVLGQATGVIMLDTLVTLVVGLVLALVNFVLLQQVMRRLDRNLLFASQVK